MINFLTTLPAPGKKGLLIAGLVVGVGLVLTAALFGSAALYAYTTQGTIAHGVRVLDLDLSGQKPEAAQQLLDERIKQALAPGFQFRLGEETLTLGPADTYVKTDATQAIQQAMAVAKGSTLIGNALRSVSLYAHAQTIDLPTVLDRARLEKDLREKISSKLVEPRDAKLMIEFTSANVPEVKIIPETGGHLIDVAPALAAAHDQTATLTFDPITLREVDVWPRLRTKDVEAVAGQVPDWLMHAPFKLTAFDHTWTVTQKMLADWLFVTSTSEGWSLGLDPEQLGATLREWTSGLVQEPVDGKLVLENEKVKEFVAPQQGLRVDPYQATDKIMAGWSNGSSTIELPVQSVMPKIVGDDAAALGIQEIIGVGRSNFSGSPSNRQRNIAHGAAQVNGSLIKPGEEFSLLKTLGPVDGVHGWLPELVIKGDKTTPEFGGGLCQIGTTVFRAALYSGLPITERRNHSYRVRYYEPAGMDATIYDPAPDLKFLNDTGHWILATSHLVGSNVSFTFWGTKDGREINVSTPVVYNIVAAPPKKIVETTEIPVGTTKCTESAHAGATASFNYGVTYPDGHTSSTKFVSYYKPWGAVCLTGVAATSTGGLLPDVPLTP